VYDLPSEVPRGYADIKVSAQRERESTMAALG
jgi:hypothetical protein